MPSWFGDTGDKRCQGQSGRQAEQGVDGEDEALLLVCLGVHDPEPDVQGQHLVEERPAEGAILVAMAVQHSRSAEQATGKGDVKVERAVEEVEPPWLGAIQLGLGPTAASQHVVSEGVPGVGCINSALARASSMAC